MANLPEVKHGLGPSLQERQSRREWVLGRIATLLSHYWRDDDPSELTEAIARDWADILEGLPQDAISKACTSYLRSEPRRKPTPGAIYALARDFVPRPVIVARSPEPDMPRERMSAERAAEIMAEVGFRPKRMGDANEGL
jgi:hypothetical protein